jgi:hypothetical protein
MAETPVTTLPISTTTLLTDPVAETPVTFTTVVMVVTTLLTDPVPTNPETLMLSSI